MISPSRESDYISTEFIVADIENRSDGSVLAIDSYDGDRHCSHETWAEWLGWVQTRGRTDKRFRTVYAHNGGGWDWLSFIEWTLRHNPKQTFHTIDNGTGRIIAVMVPLDGFTLRLTDSLYLLQCSLDDAGKRFIGRGKIVTEHLPEWYWDNDRSRFWEYLFNDTEVLYHTIVAFATMLHERVSPIAKLGLTLPACALRCFTTSFLHRKIWTPNSDRLKDALRRAYVGGRTEVFRSGEYPRINVYDVNSLYPSVMATTPVPVVGTVQWTETFVPGKCGAYRIRFSQGDRNKLPLFMVDGVGEYEGEGWYYEPEIRRFLTSARGRMTVLEGFTFTEQEIVFIEYVHTLYSLRMTDKAGPLGAVCKLLMNSLYGKFAQRPETTKTFHAPASEVMAMIRDGREVEVLNAELGIYRVAESRLVRFEHVGIAGTITSEARARLWESFDAGTVYCDTDSIHTTGTLATDPHKLGALKLEFSGRAVYCGKKLYALQNTDGEKVRAKGVRVGGKLGFKLDFAGLRSLLHGSKIVCEFQAAETAGNVMRGKNACRFSLRTRTIRKTAK